MLDGVRRLFEAVVLAVDDFRCLFWHSSRF